MRLMSHLYIVLRLRIGTAIPPLPHHVLMACAGTTLSLPLQFCWQHFLVWQIFRKTEQIHKFPTLQTVTHNTEVDSITDLRV